MIKKLFAFLFDEHCPNCDSEDYVRLGEQCYRCRKCGYKWHEDE